MVYNDGTEWFKTTVEGLPYHAYFRKTFSNYHVLLVTNIQKANQCLNSIDRLNGDPGAVWVDKIRDEGDWNPRGVLLCGDTDDLVRLVELGVSRTLPQGMLHYFPEGCGVYWTGTKKMKTVPYMDIEITDKDGRSGEVLSFVRDRLETLSRKLISEGAPTSTTHVFTFNSRLVDADRRKYSIHVHYPGLRITNREQWKLYVLHEMGTWQAFNGETTTVIDPKVYGPLDQQLFRGPYCGKKGEHNAVLIHPSNGIEFDRQIFKDSRIAVLDDVTPVLNLQNQVHLPESERRNNKRPHIETEEKNVNTDILRFFSPILEDIMVAWFAYRHQKYPLANHLRPDNITIKKINQLSTWRVAITINNDRFCETDEKGSHSSGAEMRHYVDFKKLTICQYCIACGGSGKIYNFMAPPLDLCINPVGHVETTDEIIKSKDPRVWVPFVLRYYKSFFVRDEDTRVTYYRKINDRPVWYRLDKDSCADIICFVNDISSRHRSYALHRLAMMHQKRMGECQGQEKKQAALKKAYAKARQDAIPFVEFKLSSKAQLYQWFETFTPDIKEVKMNPYKYKVPLVDDRVFDLHTGTVEPMINEHYFTSTLKYTVRNILDDECKFISDCFLEWAAGRHDLAQDMKRISGYVFSMLTFDRRWYTCKGDGLNGKSTWMEELSEIAGDLGVRLDSNYWGEVRGLNPESCSPSKMSLINKTLAVTDEIGRLFINCNKVKSHVACDQQNGRGLYESAVVFPLMAKYVWTTNSNLNFRSHLAMWERAFILPWDTKYVGHTASVDPTKFMLMRNPVVVTRIRQNRDAFLTVALHSLTTYIQSLPLAPTGEPIYKPFPMGATARATLMRMQNEVCPLLRYINIHLTFKAGGRVRVETVFEQYRVFLQAENERRADQRTTRNEFVTELQDAGEKLSSDQEHLLERAFTKQVQSQQAEYVTRDLQF